MRLSSIAGALVLAVAATSVAPVQAQKLKTNASANLIIKDIDLRGLAFDPITGVLSATGGTVRGTLAGAPFVTQITNFTLGLLDGDDAGCSILNLELAPIQIRLLGLHVDTSAICLEITAMPGEGLLGDLLCGIAGGTLPLNLLGSDALLDGLTDILSQALKQAQPGGDDGDICSGECEILFLEVGPLDLTLLGLNVYLDDCNEGPVQVCVSATRRGGVLGQILCGLTGRDLLDITLKDIAKLVKRFAR